MTQIIKVFFTSLHLWFLLFQLPVNRDFPFRFATVEDEVALESEKNIRKIPTGYLQINRKSLYNYFATVS